MKQHQNHHTNALPAFYIPFKTGDSYCFVLVASVHSRHNTLQY